MWANARSRGLCVPKRPRGGWGREETPGHPQPSWEPLGLWGQPPFQVTLRYCKWTQEGPGQAPPHSSLLPVSSLAGPRAGAHSLGWGRLEVEEN